MNHAETPAPLAQSLSPLVDAPDRQLSVAGLAARPSAIAAGFVTEQPLVIYHAGCWDGRPLDSRLANVHNQVMAKRTAHTYDMNSIDAAIFAAATESLPAQVRRAADPNTPAWRVNIRALAAYARDVAHKAHTFGLHSEPKSPIGHNRCACCWRLSPLYEPFPHCDDCQDAVCDRCDERERRQDHDGYTVTQCRECAAIEANTCGCGQLVGENDAHDCPWGERIIGGDEVTR